MAHVPKKRKYFKQYCPHCDREVAQSTWYSHYSQFFDPRTSTWDPTAEGKDSRKPRETLDFNFDSGSSGCEESDKDVQSDLSNFSFGDDLDLEFHNEPSLEGGDGDGMLEIWESEEEDLQEKLEGEEVHAVAPAIKPSIAKIVGYVYTFVLFWQVIFRLPDVAVGVLFKFLSLLFLKLCDATGSEDLQQLYQLFPDSLQKARKLQAINRDDYKKLVVCQRCHCTYDYRDCMTRTGTRITECKFVRFPKHPQRRMRSACLSPLLKTVKTASGNQVLEPLKLYCYRDVVQSIENFVQRPGMLDHFNKWKDRTIPPGIMADIYDGAVWKSFLSMDGQDFLSDRYTLGLLINVDWFQPYKHVQYSVGAIYLAILNFPRHMRYRRENMILAGIIPGPHEPSLHINSFLEPLVLDLLKLWKGVKMQTTEGVQLVRAALICNSSDVPASRKVGGFVGHGALKGCSRCLKSFLTSEFGEKADYSGFNPTTWPKRSMERHRSEAMSWKHASTLAERNRIERQSGVRFSELLRLPYFDTIRFSVVDPMHNILLGTAKLMVIVWKDRGLLSSFDFERIQCLVDRFVTPSDVGRIPCKISSGFSSFTADQWKNWTLIFSLVALKSTLPDIHYRCWYTFVRSCHLLCSRAISQAGVLELDGLLIHFCQSFEQLYGANSCTPNLHLHCHLKECLQDYGPASSFWLFACERLNGMLGSVPTNHQAIEVQLMRKFTSSQQVLNTSDDSTLYDLLGPFQSSKGSLKHEQLPELPLLASLSVSNAVTNFELSKILPPIKQGCLFADEVADVDCTLKVYFGSCYVRTLLLHKHSRAIQFNGDLYGSLNSIHSSSALVCAKSNTGIVTPGFVMKYVVVNTILHVDGTTREQEVCLAHVNWLKEHEHKHWFGAPVEVWQKYVTSTAPECFIPVTNILCRCSYLTNLVKFNDILEETVTIVVPMNYFAGLV